MSQTWWVRWLVEKVLASNSAQVVAFFVTASATCSLNSITCFLNPERLAFQILSGEAQEVPDQEEQARASSGGVSNQNQDGNPLESLICAELNLECWKRFAIVALRTPAGGSEMASRAVGLGGSGPHVGVGHPGWPSLEGHRLYL
ncbi:uncharacterized protein MELLADRAFT_111493 [Melampsora larici-populina 98AG31]|uniref:Uncharacterized protein n=1 Tax=Melampsora larici-populina (strain 98AG31 / pathotype 3-4-7) TaxID=747676 RepID=F4S3D0_MELLP|nr:uncharacterized protein MELLADRAFT_111493 [Melampsora larici-populina 98AG31]EGG00860.1 hypothetical protein MELLADRAFT_111493 [Melampsora larici-populina 98AG31]